MNKRNQQNPPRKNTVDSLGNRRYKFAAKDGGTTMPIVSGLTSNQAQILENKIFNCVEEFRGKLLVKFITF